MNKIITKGIDGDNKDLSVILDNNLFTDMVLNFLGKKEKLTYAKRTNYILRLNDIEQFFYLVNQKIEKEQTVHIGHFLVTFLYSDGTVREISGIEALNDFHETRDVNCEGVTLTWNILIKYPNADTVENQTIELSFITTEKGQKGSLLLVIRHTNQSWAIEILNLLKNKISEITKEDNKIYNFSNKLLKFLTLENFIRIIFPIFMLITTIFMIFSFPRTDGSDFYYDVVKSMKSQSNNNETMLALLSIRNMGSRDISKVADNLITDKELKISLQKIAETKDKNLFKNTKKLILGLISIFILFYLLSFYLKKVIKYHDQNSYIIISARTDKIYSDYLMTKSKMEYYSLSFLLVAIMCGVIGNLIYNYLKL